MWKTIYNFKKDKTNIMIVGCENWEPEKCVRCGALYGASSCFKSIKFKTKKELKNYYESKGGKGYYKI